MSVVARRQELIDAVSAILATARDGRIISTQESQAIDFKEEAGRRSGSDIEPGQRENPEAATKLADEVACMANTPGGGALIFGVEDKTGVVIGTELDVDWLRQRISNAVGVAPDIGVEQVLGQRLLVVYVAEAREPVPNTGNALKWRVGDRCEAVDRAEWWEHRDASKFDDPMAHPSSVKAADASPVAIAIARDWAGVDDTISDEDFLRMSGALRSDGRLTAAGALLFVDKGRSFIEVTVMDVFGGDILNRIEGRETETLLEQLEAAERTLEAINTMVTRRTGISHTSVHRVPPTAVREAMLNGIIHRDWNRGEATEVRWIEHDSTLIVRSPGGFFGSVNENNVLSNREARYPALADLFRALGLVEKQGVGVDRMYQSMIALGHRPPSIHEIAGAFVECTLVGGRPVEPVMDLVASIVPVPRQKDYRIAIIVHLLLHRAAIDVEVAAAALQSNIEVARQALAAAQQTSVRDDPLIVEYKGAWILGDGAHAIATGASTTDTPFPIMRYTSTDTNQLEQTAREWLELGGQITTGDLLKLTRVSRGTAKKALDAMVAAGELAARGAGRSSHYAPAKG
ncbi:DUF5635 domain-containing protein [Corynebacterium xerosis]|uniref:DUF5635 domain-containing protein n=1 Tax=Corynebacterium xerosis TaxID=1725 RepID=UPI00366D678A